MAIQDNIPKSRLTLTYRTEIQGALQEVSLPFRMLILAEFSAQGQPSSDRKKDLPERAPRSLSGRNLTPIMKDMGIKMSFAATNHISPEDRATLPVDLKVTSIDSFSPAHIAESVQEIKALLIIKQLLLEMQAYIDNEKEVRRDIYEIFRNDALRQKLLADPRLQAFSGLRLPGRQPTEPAAESDASPA
jgi:type VI secretion system protein ImpB